MDNDKLVSIIIPSKNRVDILKKTLQLIEDNTAYPYYEIITVIDYNDFETYKVASGGTTVKINYGKSKYVGAINSGARSAQGKYVVFLADDVFVKTGWLSEAMYVMQHLFKGVGLVKFYDIDKDKHSSYGLTEKEFAFKLNNGNLLPDEYYHFNADVAFQIKAREQRKYIVSKRARIRHLHSYMKHEDQTNISAKRLFQRDTRKLRQFISKTYDYKETYDIDKSNVYGYGG